MKNFLFFLQISLCMPLVAIGQLPSVSPCEEIPINDGSEKSIVIQYALDKLTQNNIPGVVAALWDADGPKFWSSGYAKIEEQVPMGICHLQYIQSIAKTYMAVNILQLFEEGRIDLDQMISDYLPENLNMLIPNSEKVSIRMLLTHTSGIPEYNYDPNYVTRLLQNPKKVFEPESFLQYIKNKKPDFEPGQNYSYRNSNYLILALIAEQITGDHKGYMEKNIFKKLGLENTYYGISPLENYDGKLVNSYWDRYSNGKLENISILQNSNVVSMIGDDGIITTPYEALKFLKALMEGQLISEATLGIMKEWVMNKDGDPAYGMGIHFTKFVGETAIGHSGGGLGSGAQLYYFPNKKTYMFLAINLGTVTESPVHKEAEKILESIHLEILK